MFQRMANGWALTKQSFQVLWLDKELLVFPLTSGISCLLVLASFAAPLWLTGHFDSPEEVAQQKSNVLAYVVLFAFYLVNYFVVVFFNSALVACAMIRFQGGNPTVADGFRAAWARLPQIGGWALLAATVGVALHALQSSSEKYGALAARFLGMGWTIATAFVVPVLVVERVGPIQAVKRSAAILSRAWGEALTANFGIGLVLLLAYLPAIFLAIVGGVVAAVVDVPLGIALVGIALGAMAVTGLVSAALNTIILAALYLYAATGEVPTAFDRNLLAAAFQRK